MGFNPFDMGTVAKPLKKAQFGYFKPYTSNTKSLKKARKGCMCVSGGRLSKKSKAKRGLRRASMGFFHARDNPAPKIRRNSGRRKMKDNPTTMPVPNKPRKMM